MDRWTFTSESVTEGHPDKLADQISDAILDHILAQDPRARVACETLVSTGFALVAGEITTTAGDLDYTRIVRETILAAGYTRDEYASTATTARWNRRSTRSRRTSGLPWTTVARVTRGSCSATPPTRPAS